MELKIGYRVCFCLKDGVHLAEVYAGASKKQLLGEFFHPQDLTNKELEELLKTKAAEQGLAVIPAKYAVGNFYLVSAA